MNTRAAIRLMLFAIGFIITNVTKAQSTYRLGVLPSINFNKKLERDWSINFRTEARQLARQGEFRGSSDRDFDYLLTDYSFIAAKTVGLNSRLAGGYLIRFRDKEFIHRTVQQYTIVQRMTGYRLAHRFASDQTFSPNEGREVRLRYRLTSEIPLNGQSVDPKELYLKINNEFLNSFQSSDYDLEIRAVPFLGYAFSPSHKIETGLDYRVNSFFDGSASHSFWVSLNWFIEI